MNTTQFFLKYNNKPLDNDGAFGNQCVDVIRQYFVEVLGIPAVQGNAIDYWTNPPQGFTKITKSIFNQPLPGDIMVFDYKPVGHIAICNWSRLFDFGAFEQNNPLGSVCHYMDHPNYKGVLGWLRWTGKPKPFVMQYSVFNTDSSVLETARHMLGVYTNGQIDCSFTYFTIPDISVPTLWTSEAQVEFLKKYPVSTPFVCLTYKGNDPGHSDARTSTAPGSSTIVIAQFGITPFQMCYEMTHAITEYIQDKGLPVGMPDDVFTPDETFLKRKIATILPYLNKIS